MFVLARIQIFREIPLKVKSVYDHQILKTSILLCTNEKLLPSIVICQNYVSQTALRFLFLQWVK